MLPPKLEAQRSPFGANARYCGARSPSAAVFGVTTRFAGSVDGVARRAASKRAIVFLPESATQRLPDLSNARPSGASRPVSVRLAVGEPEAARSVVAKRETF